MAEAIRIHETGGPEVLRFETIDVAAPGPGEVRLKQTAIGVNYLDIYQRSGLYRLPSLPAILGSEAAGVVEAVGSGVTSLAPGDRVAYAPLLGAYATHRLAPADRLVKLPAEIDGQTAAAMMLKGLTVRYLFRETFRVGPGTVLLFHAAAGGVGLIACQWARHLGATLIGTVGSEEKAELARAHGAAHVINYRQADFVARVREITDGKGCDVVYDSIGQATFPASLDCLKPRGLWVSFGNASGPVRAFDPGLLSQKGSLYATRPALMTYVGQRKDLEISAAELFDVVQSGAVKIRTSQRFPLKDAAEAHKALEARQTTGSTILLP